MTTLATPAAMPDTPTLALTPARAFTLDRRLPLIALALILLLAIALRFSNLETIGDGNTYYTAAVEAMLQSPSNFFYGAAEPGGSVTVDKPPLGLWLQAISAAIFGVSGVAVVLPQLIAGVISVGLMYLVVKQWGGMGAGLIAAAVLAVSPVSIAVDRNNTMDSTLIALLLAAAWTFIRATDAERHRSRLMWLIAGGVFVGLAFNVKMLQAFLPLPAFYAVYFFGARAAIGRKIVQVAIATAIMLAVALSWATIVELTPKENRPYIGSSQTNSVYELIFGYNGLERLTGTGSMGGALMPIGGQADGAGDGTAPADGALQTTPFPMGGGAPMTFMEVGEPGVTRLFTSPLAEQVGWFLPFALAGIMLAIVSARLRWPLAAAHKSVILWGGWLLIGVVFFSAARFFHAYYLATIAPAAAAMIGDGVASAWRLVGARRVIGVIAWVAAAGAALILQGAIAMGSPGIPYVVIGILVAIAGAIALIVGAFGVRQMEPGTDSETMIAPPPGLRVRPLPIGQVMGRMRYAWLMGGAALLTIGLLVAPTAWGVLTVQSAANNVLPTAFRVSTPGMGMGGAMMGMIPNAIGGQGDNRMGASDELIAYLQAYTTDTEYLVAVSGAITGAPLILETGRPVLYLGGFLGTDPVLTLEQFQGIIGSGRLRYVLNQGDLEGSQPAIGAWVTSECAIVEGMDVGGGMFDPAAMQAMIAEMDPAMLAQMQAMMPSGMTPPGMGQIPGGSNGAAAPPTDDTGDNGAAAPADENAGQTPLGGLMGGLMNRLGGGMPSGQMLFGGSSGLYDCVNAV